MKVAILGASNKPERYSYKAMKRLLEHNHEVVLINPGLETIEGIKVIRDLEGIQEKIDTLTLYVGAEISSKLMEKIVRLAPRRVIFNPGTENPELAHELSEKGIEVLEACTLVLLKTNQF